MMPFWMIELLCSFRGHGPDFYIGRGETACIRCGGNRKKEKR